MDRRGASASPLPSLLPARESKDSTPDAVRRGYGPPAQRLGPQGASCFGSGADRVGRSGQGGGTAAGVTSARPDPPQPRPPLYTTRQAPPRASPYKMAVCQVYGLNNSLCPPRSPSDAPLHRRDSGPAARLTEQYQRGDDRRTRSGASRHASAWPAGQTSDEVQLDQVYDKGTLLRVETVINNPDGSGGAGGYVATTVMCGMGSPRKSVTLLFRYRAISPPSNATLLDDLGPASRIPPAERISTLHEQRHDQRRKAVRAFKPLARDEPCPLRGS